MKMVKCENEMMVYGEIQIFVYLSSVTHLQGQGYFSDLPTILALMSYKKTWVNDYIT